MSEVRTNIIEDQLDALARRVANLEQNFRGLLKLLRMPDVEKRTGIDPFILKALCDSPTAGLVESSRHALARSKRRRDEELLEALREDLGRRRREEQYAHLTGKSLDEARRAMAAGRAAQARR